MSEVLHGTAGGDQINVSADKTQVYGLSGNDTLISDKKADALLIGGSGDDSLIMLGGKGTLAGGDGKDIFDFTYSATNPISAVIEDLDPAEDKIVVNFDGNNAPQLSSTISGNDVVWQDSDGNLNLTIKSVRENDYFDGTASDEAWDVLKLTNDEREKENLPWLTMSDGLTKAASIRAEEITGLGQNGALTNHTRPDGTDYYTVLEGKYHNYGENLDGGARSPEEVISDWMNSETHRANILDENSLGFSKLGVGYKYDDSDKSNHRWYWTQLFADKLNATETVSTKELLTAISEINTIPNLFISLSENPDTYSNNAFGATIDALGGNDFITNTNLNVSISGGVDNDTIDNRASFATINAGTGDDSINLDSSTKENVIEYKLGDGTDTISGLNSTDTVSISGDEFTPAIVGDDVIVAIGTDSITLLDAAKNGGNINGLKSKLIMLTDDDDYYRDIDDEYYSDTDEKVTIRGLGGNDTITSWSSNVSIDGGTGNDTINNSYGDNVTINSGAGDDSIYNRGANVILNGEMGDDFIYNASLASNVTINGADGDDDIHIYGTNVTVDGGAGNDYLRNYESSKISIKGGEGDDTVTIEGSFVTVEGDSGKDFVRNYGNSAVVFGGDGNDSIYSWGDNVTINGGAGDDSIDNFSGTDLSISGGDGDDTIDNAGSNVTIDGGAGDDFIQNEGSNVSIDAGAGVNFIDNAGSNVSITAGSDSSIISLLSSAQNNLIQYTSVDGNNLIFGFNETDTLKLYLSNDNYSTQTYDEDVIVYIGDYFIGLDGAASLSTLNIVVENSPNHK